MSNTGRRKRTLDRDEEDYGTKKPKSDDLNYSSSPSNDDSEIYEAEDFGHSSSLQDYSSEDETNQEKNNCLSDSVTNSNQNKIRQISKTSTNSENKSTSKKEAKSVKPKSTANKRRRNTEYDAEKEHEVMDFQRKIKPSTENTKLPNIYNSSNLEVLSRGMMLYGRRYKNNESERLVDNAVVPKLKQEFEKLNKYKRPTAITQVEYKPPDEVLTNDYELEANELLYLNRDEIKEATRVELPREDVTNAIHYYVAKRIKTRFGLSDREYDEKFSRIFDGSSLLALSALVTNWVEESCGENTYKAYMETIKSQKEKLSSIDEFIRVYDESSTSESDESSQDSSSSDEEVEQINSSDLSEDEKKINLVNHPKKEESDFSDLDENASNLESIVVG